MSFINIPNLEASLNYADIVAALGYVPVNKAGDTMTGYLTLNANPTSALHAATKQYVDNVASGLNAKGSCRVASTANIVSLSGLLTIDGVTVSIGDRILVKNQTSAAQNGIYVADVGPWTRATDLDSGAEAVSAFTFVGEGSTQSSTGWVQITPAPITIGVTSLVWTQFSGAGTYTADNQGVILTGNQFSLQIANSTLSQSGAGVKVATGGITNNEVNAGAAIAYSKLNLTNSIVNADINSAAAIARSKIASGSANHVVINDGSGVLSSEAQLSISRGGTALGTTPSNGQLLIGNGTNYTLATLTGTTNQVNISNGAGSITLSTPQDIATTSSPSFAALNTIGTAGNGYLSTVNQSSNPSTPASGFKLFADSSNRLSWKGTNGFVRTFDGTANTADRVYTLPNITGTFILDQGQQSINGGKTFVPVTLTDAANIATDVSLGNTFRVTLGGNRNLSAPTNPVNGQKVTWVFIQDATGGRTLTFDPIFNFGTFPTLVLSGSPNKRDYMGAIYSGTTSSWNVVAYSVGF